MKNSFASSRWMFALAMLVMISCSKKDDPITSKQATLTTSKGWKVTAITVTPEINGTSNFYSFFPNCVKDNIEKFLTTGKFVEDEGATKCDAADPQSAEGGTWVLNSDNTVLTVTRTGKDPVEYHLTTFTATTIVATNTQTDTGSGTTYTYTSTFTAVQ
jgi:hypothetical protein